MELCRMKKEIARGRAQKNGGNTVTERITSRAVNIFWRKCTQNSSEKPGNFV